MPTHAEVIAQNPLEAPADFWTNAARLVQCDRSGVVESSGIMPELWISAMRVPGLRCIMPLDSMLFVYKVVE